MNLRHLTDHQLKLDTQNLVQSERALLTQILYHLKEINSRKLYSDYGYKSLFEYACKELKYSSDQTFRRIEAMKLLTELPELANKIDSGELSLSNINQAQKHFKQEVTISKEQKFEILEMLSYKSVREGQKELLKIQDVKPLPEETKKQITPTHTHVSFCMSEELEAKLEHLKSLLGPKSYTLSMADLIEHMAELATAKLTEKKFGKKMISSRIALRCADRTDSILEIDDNSMAKNEDPNNSKLEPKDFDASILEYKNSRHSIPECSDHNDVKTNSSNVYEKNCKSTLNVQSERDITMSKRTRYIPKKIRYKIWQKAQHKCQKCESKTNLQIDHLKPFALGGLNSEENLRLLCFNCNQRSRINAVL